MHSYRIKYASDSDHELWDGYVRKHPDASLSQMFGWRNVIRGTYGHATYYLMLMACDGGVDATEEHPAAPEHSTDRILGVLPLVHFKHAIFGNSLVSMPFLDTGGILASSSEAEGGLLDEVVRLGRKTGADRIELRHAQPLLSCNHISASCKDGFPQTTEGRHEVR